MKFEHKENGFDLSVDDESAGTNRQAHLFANREFDGFTGISSWFLGDNKECPQSETVSVSIQRYDYVGECGKVKSSQLQAFLSLDDARELRDKLTKAVDEWDAKQCSEICRS